MSYQKEIDEIKNILKDYRTEQRRTILTTLLFSLKQDPVKYIPEVVLKELSTEEQEEVDRLRILRHKHAMEFMRYSSKKEPGYGHDSKYWKATYHFDAVSQKLYEITGNPIYKPASTHNLYRKKKPAK